MNQKTLYTGIAVVIVLIVVGVFFILGVPFSTSSINSETQAPITTTQAAQGTTTGQSQIAMQDIATGSGRAAAPGDTITVNYTGKFQDGTVFDTSVGKAPFSFTLGAGQVIQGWDQGLVGAQAGTKRILVIPPALGYGPADYGPIPGNSTLMFEVDVLKVEPAGVAQ
ncbi:MAG TPA: FKBP-type peptidyl-prolyl cis-trans isomerase [Candidatus Paceibacterota bacterium]|jgi:FKBP-type peptidyl-prolyl cis-trans isomerase|nr:FKBP-type peptidyl-prolyl cis-trans isomerase [Candidatus Paceibacterota bacterium]